MKTSSNPTNPHNHPQQTPIYTKYTLKLWVPNAASPEEDDVPPRPLQRKLARVFPEACYTSEPTPAQEQNQ
ncbi:hypothetical protein Ahy_A07g032857 isoform C [Arachis hypogaea]|uniref:Uncharacterized protein n=1 Tax=Arachis hypogaea TaxID=3818 RepID=A0A445C7P3_ARAHY|nr:hypothetical protein Ahy_A07g032857 isoform C [Arachis hypogaea]